MPLRYHHHLFGPPATEERVASFEERIVSLEETVVGLKQRIDQLMERLTFEVHQQRGGEAQRPGGSSVKEMTPPGGAAPPEGSSHPPGEEPGSQSVPRGVLGQQTVRPGDGQPPVRCERRGRREAAVEP
ncbi:hypothetical protein N9L68_09040 [bacterium]|nr:hypothetical protein [bacterium]